MDQSQRSNLVDKENYLPSLFGDLTWISVYKQYLVFSLLLFRVCFQRLLPCHGNGPGGGGGGEYSQKKWVGTCSLLPKPLTLFPTKICNVDYPISDLTKNLIPFFKGVPPSLGVMALTSYAPIKYCLIIAPYRCPNVVHIIGYVIFFIFHHLDTL